MSQSLTVNSLIQQSATSSASATFFANNTVLVAASTSDLSFLNTGREVVLLQNSSSQGAGAAITVRVIAQVQTAPFGPITAQDLSTSVPSSSFGLTVIGPFPPSIYNDTSGLCHVQASANGLQVGVLSVAPRS
jgi:hypothetical protein